jgi:ABC-type transporter Mla MlaB component
VAAKLVGVPANRCGQADFDEFLRVKFGFQAVEGRRGTSDANGAKSNCNSSFSTLQMLRISTTESAENGPILRLEGQLAGPWIEELDCACEDILRAGRTLTLDLEDVSLIDRPGLALLASLSRRAVVLVGCSPFHTEQLRQAAATDHATTTTLP